MNVVLDKINDSKVINTNAFFVKKLYILRLSLSSNLHSNFVFLVLTLP